MYDMVGGVSFIEIVSYVGFLFSILILFLYICKRIFKDDK